ncbi:hypothetical protein SDC9_146083 [bioreactor metagenome]|uniref:Uncharacterized protein n=1 Tax=bioreactor metagenome TaxID=1076179 RepID=A0A645EDQ0_9ZZZZ
MKRNKNKPEIKVATVYRIYCNFSQIFVHSSGNWSGNIEFSIK